MEKIYILAKQKKPTSYLQFSQEDVRKMHLDFNNYHYWKSNENKENQTSKLEEKTTKPNLQSQFSKMWDAVQIDN